MEINDKAPEFTSLDQNGEKIALKDYKGKWVVLYFYPRADTPGCTVEACEFRDGIRQFSAKGVAVVGVSPDNPAAQANYKEKNMYGKKVMGIERTTFIIGPDGRIEKIYAKVKAKGHAAEVLAAL